MTEPKLAPDKISLKLRLRLFFFVVPAVFLADYFSKYFIQRYMVPYRDTIAVIDGLVKFHFIYNEGIAFGINPGFISGWLLIVVSAGVALALVGYIIFSDYSDRTGLVSLCLICGGAFGNLYDRLVYGQVVDFIECGIKDLTWPVFNAADIAVTCGAVLLALRLFTGSPEAGKVSREGRAEAETQASK